MEQLKEHNSESTYQELHRKPQKCGCQSPVLWERVESREVFSIRKETLVEKDLKDNVILDNLYFIFLFDTSIVNFKWCYLFLLTVEYKSSISGRIKKKFIFLVEDYFFDRP